MAVTAQTAAGTNSLVNNAYSQGQQLQNMYNNQSQQAQGQYQTAQNNAYGAQSDLQNFTKNMVNGGDYYKGALTDAQQMYGFDPTSLLKANQALANTQTTLANLPQAIQQQGNYYGTTAGAEAGNYSNLAGNLNSVQQGQSNAVNAFQQVLQATQQQANQQTGNELTGQQNQLGGYEAAASNATGIMQNAGTVMNNIEQLQQQQGYLTAQQVSAYQNAYSNYVNAQAAMSQAGAANISARATQQLDAAQAAYYNEQVNEAQKTSSGNTGGLSVQPYNNSGSILSTVQGTGGKTLSNLYGGIQ